VCGRGNKGLDPTAGEEGQGHEAGLAHHDFGSLGCDMCVCV
jgi:hypothetical protein